MSVISSRPRRVSDIFAVIMFLNTGDCEARMFLCRLKQLPLTTTSISEKSGESNVQPILCERVVRIFSCTFFQTKLTRNRTVLSLTYPA